jgi:hypothetical protein
MLRGDKNAILDNSYRWPNARIPYEISAQYSTYTYFPKFYKRNHNKYFVLGLPADNRLWLFGNSIPMKSNRTAYSHRIRYERLPR